MRAFRLLVFLLLAPAATSCIAAVFAAGAAGVFGVVMYDKNEARRDYGAGMDATWKATVQALRNAGTDPGGSPGHGPTEGEIEVGDVWVRVERHAGDFTRVRVRIGTFHTEDHRRRAKLILEDIGRQLGGEGQ